ncbi:MraY family glycosyltransferase [Cecembia rubra]|uniref:UDP-N-acetylmuramyl pentapeptide phosphotransferase/UDP-N-acetylglucosamine-1-phosphate transferase n=1 Tax=Cecembia rubra TaxID=1485585 RepID=A0A2P8E3B2_9BACT|nr:glycosyltransferase family 4 protein [Cecembia rubra]PSL03972.1 UDP-N-acetylmuramyl pentapeptide phosphotransferase/UDP-N-acetylglucosamine-1-phosphate transferase [Cecembia rubra]
MINLALVLLPLYFLLFELYLRVAKRCDITDVPNQRSSHTKVTVRGGGIIFVVGAFTAFVLGYIGIWPLLGLIISALAGFVDDLHPLPTWPRLLAHFSALLLLLWGGGLFILPWWLIIIIMIIFTGWVNVFNFMDGINGITVLYSLVALGTFYFLPEVKEYKDLIVVMGLALIVFAFYNFRKKAIAFAGDVGSISLAFLIGFLWMDLIFLSDRFYYILFLSVYLLDALFTILIRLLNRENILKPHRKHLYQYLANELGQPHLKISLFYVLIQLFINTSLIYWSKKQEISISQTLMVLLFLALSYLAVRYMVWQKILKMQHREMQK